MGSSLSPHKDGETVIVNGKEVVVTDAGEFITHIQGEGDTWPRPVTNEQITKKR